MTRKVFRLISSEFSTVGMRSITQTQGLHWLGQE